MTTLAPLKYVRSISAPLSPLQARRFRDKFGVTVLNCYGQTEIGGEIVGWNAADARAYGEEKLGSIGRPHEGVEVRIEEATGELHVRTPATAAGLRRRRPARRPASPPTAGFAPATSPASTPRASSGSRAGSPT